MEKFITDERTGLRYELVGDYYLIAGDYEPEEQHIQRIRIFRKLLVDIYIFRTYDPYGYNIVYNIFHIEKSTVVKVLIKLIALC